MTDIDERLGAMARIILSLEERVLALEEKARDEREREWNRWTSNQKRSSEGERP